MNKSSYIEKAFDQLSKKNIPQEVIEVFQGNINTLGQLAVANTPQKKGKKMYDLYGECDEFNLEQTRLQYLKNRLSQAFCDKNRETEKKYGMLPVDQPKNRAEATERLNKGHFAFYGKDDPDGNDYPFQHAWFQKFYWTDPEHPQDKKGWEKASEDINKAYQDVLDTIMLKDADAALEAIKTFESTEF